MWTSKTPGPAASRDAGRVSIFLAIAVAGIFAIVGVAVDASGQLRTLMRADNIASEAARTAGQGIDGPQAIQGNQVVVDPAKAVSYADQYLATALASVEQDYEDPNVVLLDGGATVEVEVTLTYETRVLGLFGLDTIDVTATSTAQLVTG